MQMDLDMVSQVGGDSFIAVDVSGKSLANAWGKWVTAGLWVRWLWGTNMLNECEVFSGFANALQFPYYFGWNWAAFDECLSQMDMAEAVGVPLSSGLPVSTGIVVIVFDAGEVLSHDPEAMGVLVRSLQRARQVYATPIDRGEWWDRPAVPFHVVLQLGRDQAARWEDVGASLLWFDLSDETT